MPRRGRNRRNGLMFRALTRESILLSYLEESFAKCQVESDKVVGCHDQSFRRTDLTKAEQVITLIFDSGCCVNCSGTFATDPRG